MTKTDENMARLQAVSKILEGSNMEDTLRMEDRKSPEIPDKKDSEDPKSWEYCDFETAISATGYGKYNILLLGATAFPMFACISTTSTMSFILPSAECDLNLDSFHKGMLNACVYVGCIMSAFLWGFLSDTLGRQKLLVVTLAIDFFLSLTAALSQNFELLLFAKLTAGFVSSGPFSIMMSYLAECHSAQHRASVILWAGAFTALGTVSLPVLAWVIIPSSWSITILGLYLPSWRIFLAVCSLPSLISSLSLLLAFESPKFLMSQGRNDEAMEVFRSIYRINSGQPEDQYPVKSLIDEKKLREKLGEIKTDENNKSIKNFLSAGWSQMSPLFRKPHLKNALIVFTCEGFTLFGLCIRLWMPQLFSLVLANQDLTANATTVCEIIKRPAQEEIDIDELPIDCSMRHVDGQVYINSIIIGLTTAALCLASGSLLKAIGKKWLIVGCAVVGFTMCSGMYWATTVTSLLIQSALLVAFTTVGSQTVFCIVVDLFPTTLRTMAVNMTLTLGRGCAIIGNLLFPFLLDLDCTVPFFLLASVLACAGLIILIVPSTKGKALE